MFIIANNGANSCDVFPASGDKIDGGSANAALALAAGANRIHICQDGTDWDTIGAASLGADVVSGSNIADDAIDSEHYVDASIDAAHIASNAVTTAKINADAVTGAKIADDAIDSEHYAAGSIDEAHIADNAVTLAKMAGGTDGNIISFDASGDPVAIATGNDGQVLTSAGAGAPPAFEDAGGGGVWTLIGTSTASSSASLTQTGLDISTYTKHLIVLSGIEHSATSTLEFRWGPSGGVSSSGYSTNCRKYAQNSDGGIDGVASHDGGSQNYQALNVGTFSGSQHHHVEIGLYQSTAGSSVGSQCSGFWMGPNSRGIFGGTNDNTSAVTQIHIQCSTGNIVVGRMSVWGLAHA